jgi:hypothetical protein
MFKRVDRRRKRKEKEERLGLDENQLGVFGLYHTDSSESESDSSDSASTSASTSSSDGLTTQPRKKRKREASPPTYDENKDGESATDDEEDEGNIDHGSHPPLTIASALKEPIRPDSESEAWVCAFCPGKTLKHAAMVKVHEASQVRIDSNHSVNIHIEEPLTDSPAAFQAYARARHEIQSGRRHPKRTCKICDRHTAQSR